MTRACAVVIAAALLPIGSLAAVAGASPFTHDINTQRRTPRLRGRRTTTVPEPPGPPSMAPTCSSIGCPIGSVPIADHGTTECYGGNCTVRQCCEAMCAGYGCPNGYTPIESRAVDLCHGGVCTRHQCCETAPAMCNSIECPNGYEPIDNALEVECLDGECDVDQCCEAMCASHACPDDYTPIRDAAEMFCTDGICTTVECCDHYQDAGERCADHTCPSGTEPRADAQQDMCAGAHGCQSEQCCDSTDKMSRPSPPSPSTSFCKDFQCPGGYHLMDGVDYVECFGDECEKYECCERDDNMPEELGELGELEEPDYDYCSSFPCPSETHRPVEKADQVRCAVVEFLAPAPASSSVNGSRRNHHHHHHHRYYSDAMMSDDGEHDDFVVVVPISRALVVSRGHRGHAPDYYHTSGYGRDNKGRGSDQSSDREFESSGLEAEGNKDEYCNVHTCCIEKEFGLRWSLE